MEIAVGDHTHNFIGANEIAREVRTFSPRQLEECVSEYVGREGKLPDGSSAEALMKEGHLPPAELVAEEMTYAIPSCDIRDELRKLSQERLDECVASFKARRGILAEGPAAQAIVQAARELPAELVVVGTHGRSGFDHLVMGSVAETVIREAPCSVLVVRLTP
jgi:nucleotide-binding universal stress UspA family protein